MNLEVYLYFKGNCKEAMEFYKSIFGGELQVNTYSDSPGTDPEHKDWIMHANLSGGDVKLMASDTPNASDKTAKVELTLGGTDEAKMRETFEKLSAGGQVVQPLKKEFWGDVYGKLTDRFGVDWSMNIGSTA